MKPELRKACETIADYMDRPRLKRYLISNDGGDSYSLEFDCPLTAEKYLDEMQTKGYSLEYEVVEKDFVYWGFLFDLDDLVPAWEKLGIEGIEHYNNIVASHWTTDLTIWVNYNPDDCIRYHANGETIQEAACLATAQAINTLRESE